MKRKESVNMLKIRFLSSRKEESFRRISGAILRNYGYKPISLSPESLVSDNLLKSIEYGVDNIIYTNEIPANDYLNIKQVNPFNRDYISFDSRSNNFRNLDVVNDNYVFIKLMEFFPNEYYSRDVLLEKIDAKEDIRIKGILSHQNPDYLFLIRNTFNKSREDISRNSLINAYLLPVEPLKLQVIEYLNFIRDLNDKKPLNLGESVVESILDIYQTWELYDRHRYNFELINVGDVNRHDLFMKISKNNLLNYYEFDLNGFLVDFKS
ncbi:hypothetical protein [Methanobacterium sp. MBAC-LM]|uniref:hypothetical protein n=1 Tax=Methanobacterium sp. MBAC-LM TaxID=3412034 RepID=UPI003C74DA1D